MARLRTHLQRSLQDWSRLKALPETPTGILGKTTAFAVAVPACAGDVPDGSLGVVVPEGFYRSLNRMR